MFIRVSALCDGCSEFEMVNIYLHEIVEIGDIRHDNKNLSYIKTIYETYIIRLKLDTLIERINDKRGFL